MTRSALSRRAFLTTAGVIAASGSAVASYGDTSSVVAQTTRPQSEDGILYHQDLHKIQVMEGFYPPKDKRVTIHNWHTDTHTVRYTHLHEDRVFKTTPIFPDKSRLWALPRRMIEPEKLANARILWGRTEEHAEKITIADWLKRSHTDAFIAIHDGHIVSEQYFGDMTPHMRHSVWSSSKSLIAMMMAGLFDNGKLDERNLVTSHIPELSGSAFEKATIRQMFDQTTGVELKTFPGPKELEKMTEAQRKEYEFGSLEHRRANNDFSRLIRALGEFLPVPGEENVGMYDLILTLKKSRDHGECFYYADANPIAAQWMLELMGKRDFIAQTNEFWQQLGAEDVAMMKLDPIGTAVGTIGLSMTVRDYARLGLAMANRGRAGNGTIFPGIGELADDLRRDPGPERWTDKTNFLGQTRSGNGYKSFFWTYADKVRGEVIPYMAGLHGQRVYFDQSRDVVLAKFSTNLGHSWEEEIACPSFVRLLPDLVG